MATHMFGESSVLPDVSFENRSGRPFAGVAIGILLFGTADGPLPPGAVENATTFNYPVHFRPVPEAITEVVVKGEGDDTVRKGLVEGAKDLEDAGCRAIIGACGYFGNYLPEVRAAVNIPVFMSSLMQLPLILNSIPPERKVLVLCADAGALPGSKALRNSGVIDESRLVIGGGRSPDVPEMDLVLASAGAYNPSKLQRELVETAKKHVREDPGIGAVLMECTLFPSHSYAVSNAVNLPVWDFVSMIDWVQGAVVKRSYHGFI